MIEDEPGAAVDPRAERRAVIALFLATLVMVAAHVLSLYQPNTWINRDGRFYTNMNVTLVEDGSLEQSGFAHSWYEGNLPWNRNLPGSFSNIALGRNGEHWPMHPWMMPVVSTPLFFAFGLIATLMFNVLMFSVIAGMGYRFARAWVSPSAATLAVVTFLFGTAIHEYAYDYHVDIFLLALLTTTLAALVTRHGTIAGATYAAILCLKPTSLILAPFVLIILFTFGDRRVLRDAVLSGAVVLAVVGAINTYMFGAPWRFGYLRVLTVENGEQVLVSDEDAFGTPLREGMERVWNGTWGLRHRMSLMVLALPGLVALLVRRPIYAFPALATWVVSYLVFSKYHFEGDRFHWPATALLLPALGQTFDLLRPLLARLRALRPTHFRAPAAFVAALVAIAAMIAHVANHPRAIDDVAQTAYGFGALAVAEHGSYDLADHYDAHTLGIAQPSSSRVTLGRFGQYLPRASPPAVLTAAPFALFGPIGLVVLHVLLAAVAVFAAARAGERVAPRPIAAMLPASLLLLPISRAAVLHGGPGLFAAAFGMLAVLYALQRKWLAAAVLGALAAWYGDAPWLFGLGVVLLAAMESPSGLRRAALGAGVVLALWGVSHLVLIGRPFASPEDFVLVRFGGEVRSFAFAGESPLVALETLAEARTPRFLLVLLALAPLGLVSAWRRDPRFAVLALVALLSVLAPGVLVERAAGGPSFAVALVALLPIGALVAWVAVETERFLHTARRRTRLAAALSVLLALVGVGAVRRSAEASAPFRLASERGLRTAKVSLNDRIPCDFLPWEHMSWECSQYDRGHFNQVGFALPEGLTVGGEPAPDLLLVPIGTSGQRRVVRWEGVRATDAFRLRYAVPDRIHGGVTVTLTIDGTELTALALPAESTRRIEEVTLDTSAWAGRDVTLTLEVRGRRVGGETGVAVDGGFVPPRG